MIALLALAARPAVAQQSVPPMSAVPRLVNYSGRAIDAQGKAVIGVVGITFAIYGEQTGGVPVWLETQSVAADAKGVFTAQLGMARPGGLPLDLFSAAEARWLGVRINGGEEQPRVLLLSVPYALKAADAETIGGLPPSAFILAGRVASPSGNPQDSVVPTVPGLQSDVASNVTTTGGTINSLPLWTTATNVQSSAITQTGSGATARIGINLASPAAALDVKGAAIVRGNLGLPATGVATATAGKNSQPETFTASAFDSATSTAVNQNFRWQAEPVENNTASPSATLNLLYGIGSAAPTETGLSFASNGLITFAPGQTFPGSASGTVTSVGLTVPGMDFSVSGSPITTSGALGLHWKVMPTNLNTANAIVKRDANGSFSAGPIAASTTSASIAALSGADNSGSSSGQGILGTSANGYGVYGVSTSSGGVFGVGYTGGVYGNGFVNGVVGYGNNGVYGNGTVGVNGVGAYNTSGYGVIGSANTGVLGTGGAYGVSGEGTTGVYGNGQSYGVYGRGDVGVYGEGFYSDGVQGVTDGAFAGVYGTSNGGWALDGYGTAGATGVLAGSDTGYAAWFNGDVQVDGILSATTKHFKIDHPLDPANKYLVHASVESSEMKDIYDGMVTTDAQGEATVRLPEWFEALNTSFRYQLTVIGQFAQAIVSREIQAHEFQIRTNLANVKVSWQVTGVRQDAYAKAHPMVVEENKPVRERGFYQHPELYGASAEKGILWAGSSRAMKQWQETRAKAEAPQAKEAPAKP